MASTLLLVLHSPPLWAQSFRVQCPDTTTLHPNGAVTDPAHPGLVKCQEIGGGDGFATMGDGHQIYLFGFSPLSGLGDPSNNPAKHAAGILTGESGTQTPDIFKSTTDARRARIEPAEIMNTGVLYSNAPAPLITIDEDDELFLTLSNVGQIMRPDLFEQHTVHFHGYPNASAFFDGVPDASIAINIAGSFTYYYTAPDAGTYFWHCHIAPPEHLQMGMVGQLYVRPRQNRLTRNSSSTAAALQNSLQTANLRAARPNPASADGWNGQFCSDILCTGQTPVPSGTSDSAKVFVTGTKFAYNDGDGSTRYDVEYPIQMMGFDPNFHYVGMTFNPEAFSDMKDKYFMLSGRSYPDTVGGAVNGNGKVVPGPMSTMGADGVSRPSQPLPSLITIKKSAGQTRALLRVSNLSVSEFSTLATVGIPMTVVGVNARLLRDMSGSNMYYDTNSITMGGGESTDVILDASNVPTGTYFLYSTNLDHLSNDAENFGGMMTEIVVD
jgi:FtsP/CotA-like multicopper oxidase with cupredoxin domain